MKSDSRAAKVTLMKLKMKAAGEKSIPQVIINLFISSLAF